MMTLNEAIEHAIAVGKVQKCGQCAREHYQLAEWLDELQYRRESVSQLIEKIEAFKIDKNQAISGDESKINGFNNALDAVVNIIKGFYLTCNNCSQWQKSWHGYDIGMCKAKDKMTSGETVCSEVK